MKGVLAAIKSIVRRLVPPGEREEDNSGVSESDEEKGEGRLTGKTSVDSNSSVDVESRFLGDVGIC